MGRLRGQWVLRRLAASGDSVQITEDTSTATVAMPNTLTLTSTSNTVGSVELTDGTLVRCLVGDGTDNVLLSDQDTMVEIGLAPPSSTVGTVGSSHPGGDATLVSVDGAVRRLGVGRNLTLTDDGNVVVLGGSVSALSSSTGAGAVLPYSTHAVRRLAAGTSGNLAVTDSGASVGRSRSSVAEAGDRSHPQPA